MRIERWVRDLAARLARFCTTEDDMAECVQSAVDAQREKLDAHATAKVQHVFAHWVETMGRTGAKLTEKRRKCIRARLREGYTVEQLCRAVDGCKASEFHQGRNVSGTVYDDLTLICRDGEHVEGFGRRRPAASSSYAPEEKRAAEAMAARIDVRNRLIREGRMPKREEGEDVMAHRDRVDALVDEEMRAAGGCQ